MTQKTIQSELNFILLGRKALIPSCQKVTFFRMEIHIPSTFWKF